MNLFAPIQSRSSTRIDEVRRLSGTDSLQPYLRMGIVGLLPEEKIYPVWLAHLSPRPPLPYPAASSPCGPRILPLAQAVLHMLAPRPPYRCTPSPQKRLYRRRLLAAVQALSAKGSASADNEAASVLKDEIALRELLEMMQLAVTSA